MDRSRPRSLELQLDNVEMTPRELPDSVAPDLDSVVEVPDSVALDNIEMTPQELPDPVAPDLDSVVEVPDSVALDNVEPLDSVKEVPDSVEEVQYPRCVTFHAGGVFGEACFQARRNARRCARCGLLHEDYDVPARFLYGVDKFDCEFFIPDVEKLEMHANTIILPEEIVKKLEEHDERTKQTKISPQANKEDEAKQDQ
ncbi:unnamed protein product [Miscanthus lutarioriparius]|uniref:Uncharacterized protein n=1 Tax=Miscanthus lutarioriparius TaxID=422564 RepID=A0A811MWZ2_9POAL|nr:unnamed protein product [Miscanthus lutarioriparius]